MSFVVYNKNTGMYLNPHIGSYRDYIDRVDRYLFDYKFKNPKPVGHVGMHRNEPEWMEKYNAYRDEWSSLKQKRNFKSDAGNSRRYHSRGSAITSVGNYGNSRLGIPMSLPDHLEIHEIEVEKVTVKRR